MTKSVACLLLLVSASCLADNMTVDKIYHPYVLANEREVEWRLMSSNTDAGNLLAQRLGYGQAFTENKSIEFYVVGERDSDDNFTVSGYEIETRWMLTEQGEYSSDWGAFFEIEKQDSEANYEFSSGLIVEKELGKVSATLNGILSYEWGDTAENELEIAMRGKVRYRYLSAFQPSVEFHVGERFAAIGPGFMGTYRFDGQKQLKWEASFVTEVSQPGKHHTLRFGIEYEF